VFGAFQSLDQAVLHRIGGGHKPGGALGFIQTLVMQAVDLEETGHANHGRCLGARRKVYLVGHIFAGIRLGLVTVAGQVLNQPAPAGDVEDLHPPADCQHRHVMLQRVMEQTQVQVVQRAVDFQAGLRVGFLIV